MINQLITRQLEDKVSDQFVKTVEHLAAKDTDVSIRSWWRPNLELKVSDFWICGHKYKLYYRCIL